MNNFLNDIVKESKNEFAGVVADGVEAGDVQGFIDTGSYVFNALLSGSIYGGLLRTRLQRLLVSPQLVRPSLHLDYVSIS